MKKIDFRNTSSYFIAYLKKFKSCRFYYLKDNIRIIAFGNYEFIENGDIS